MTLIESVVKLFLRQKPGEPDMYILESTATFPDNDYIPQGHAPIPTSLNNTNELELDLFISDGNSTTVNSSSTVIHTINLGELNFGQDNFGINVSLKKGGTKKGKGHVRNIDAVILSKPDKIGIK